MSVKRFLYLSESEAELLQQLLMDTITVDFMTFGEYQTLNSLRLKMGLPPVEGLAGMPQPLACAGCQA
ncbi:MAG: hypothetical protein WC291_07270 [Thermodesulfovibrionales bacterium]